MAPKRDQKDWKKFMEKSKTAFKYIYAKIDQFQKGLEYLGSQNMERKKEIADLKEELEHLAKENERTKRKVADLKKKVKYLDENAMMRRG